MNILLVNPPTLFRRQTGAAWRDCDPAAEHMPYYQALFELTAENGRSTVPGEHLGLQSIQSSLEADGHRVTVVDACAELHSSLARTLARIQEHPYDLVGFTGPVEVLAENLWLASSLRQSGYSGHITIGHDFATLNHERILSLYDEIDSVVRGEGEVTARELAAALSARTPLSAVRGLTFRDGGRVVVNPSRSVVDDLDRLPPVARPNTRQVMRIGLSPAVYTRRGCPYECAFCTTGAVPKAEGVNGKNRWRRRSAAAVVDELEYLVKDFGVRHVTMVDDLYLTKGSAGSQHAVEVAEEILRRHLTIEYMIDCRVDSIDREVFATLKRSGLRRVYVGVESGDDEVLLAFRKGYASSRIAERLRVLTELGLDYIPGFIMFTPTATLAGLEQSRQLIGQMDTHKRLLMFFSEATVYPGTPLEHDLRHRGLLRGEFPHYTAEYADPQVSRLRRRMKEFTRLALPRLLGRKGADRDRLETAVRDMLMRSFGEMIACFRRGDASAADAAYSHLLHEFKAVVRST
jgi:radical SAM superfamily enzyme YgiQ (UPF0313 family)